MTDVFISYKKEDVSRVQPIAEALAQAGYDVWWDHRIPPGRTYRDVIGAALDAAKCVIVVWSENSTKSQWVLDEADVGAKRRVLLPILIDNIMPPLGFTQIEAARLIGWDGDAEALEWKHTVEAVGHLVGRAPGAVPPVQISMPSSGGAADSAAMLRATPGAMADMSDASAPPKKKGGGGAGWIMAAILAIAVLGGGGYYAIANNLFSGSLPPGGVDEDQPEAAGEIAARVFMHISDESQRREAQQIANVLGNAGHTVEGIQNVGEISPRGVGEVRYFSEASKPFADAVVEAMTGGYFPPFEAKLNPNFPDVPTGDVEIYFSFVQPSETLPETPVDAQPQSRFGSVTAANVQSVTMSDGMVLGVLPDGRWALRFRGGELEGTFRETNRDDGSVFMRHSNTNEPLEIDMATGTVYTEPYTNKQVLYSVSSASTAGIEMPSQRGFPGINGTNVMSVVTDEGRIGHLKDGFWGALAANGLPENTFQEVGRDEWSVYLNRVSDGARFRIDTYSKTADFFSNQANDFRKMSDLQSASTSSLPVPQIADATFFMFGPDLRFERVQNGGQTVWQEYRTETGEWTYRWTEVARDGHFMELADDGRGARMRVDLIQAQVYLLFPDGDGFQPQWKVTDMQ